MIKIILLLLAGYFIGIISTLLQVIRTEDKEKDFIKNILDKKLKDAK